MSHELPKDTKCKHCDTGCKFCDARFMWQTPYAWFHYKDFTLIYHDVWEELIEGTDDWVPLYLEQQRTWVGLTDEEIKHIEETTTCLGNESWLRNLTRNLEDKLKEKNT
jgi:hypothetical protein